jgi:hypothetical protein
MVIPTITFANSSSVSDYVDPSFQDYLRNGSRRDATTVETKATTLIDLDQCDGNIAATQLTLRVSKLSFDLAVFCDGSRGI